MNLLFVTNYYPPQSRGGYEMHCYENAKGLSARGHSVYVLSSRSKTDYLESSSNIFRTLYLQSENEHYQPFRFFTRRALENRLNMIELQAAVKAVEPDLILVWGMWNISLSLLVSTEAMGMPIAYWIGDLWPITPDLDVIYWRSDANRFWSKPLKRAAAKFAFAFIESNVPTATLEFKNIAFGSHYLKEKIQDAGFLESEGQVINCGIDLELFSHDIDWGERFEERQQSSLLRLIFVGRLSEDKGIVSVIHALNLLKARRQTQTQVSLTIVGRGSGEFETRLATMIDGLKLLDDIDTIGIVRNKDLPGILERHDVLVFPSIVQEGFGRVVAEAMASGLAVIGTGSGGSAELIENKISGLSFRAGDSLDLANAIEYLMNSPELYIRIAREGQRRVQANYSLHSMVDQMEEFLQGICDTT